MCPIFTTLFILAALAALIYIFLIWNFNYWTKRGLKCAKSYPFVGSFPSQFTQKRNMVYDVDEIYRKFKKTEHFVGIINCRLPQVLTINPEFSRKVLVSDFSSFHDNGFSAIVDKQKDRIFANNPFILTGDEWKERRAEVTPGLTANRVAAVYPVTLDVCAKFVDYIHKQQQMATRAVGINAKDICLCYTTEVVSDCVLGITAQSFTDNPTPIVEKTKHVFDNSFSFFLYATIANAIPCIRKFFTVSLFKEETQKFFYDLMKTSIELRRKNTQHKERNDFLNYMLQLQDKKNLNTMELTSHTMTFLTDGFETSASVMSHVLLLLARYPETQKRLLEEVGSAPLSFEQLSELPYLEACILEALRMFPPQLIARKLVTKPVQWTNKDGNSVKLLPGQVAIIPAYSIHHDAEYYEDPEEFKPERFLEENGGGARKFREMGVFLGFGDGPRVCPGMRFALTQMKAGLVSVVRAFNIKVSPKTRKDNYLHDTYFMAALHGGIWLQFEDRA